MPHTEVLISAGIRNNAQINIKRSGWFAFFLMDYKLDSVTPGLIVWYSSGDDSNTNNGSERLPTINPDVTVTSYGFDKTNFSRAAQTLGMGISGTMGIVADLKDIIFLQNVTHQFRFGYYKGTNNIENVRNGAIYRPDSTLSCMYYLTTADSAQEVNIDTSFKIYKNLTLFIELGYIRMDLDEELWNAFPVRKNNFKAAFSLQYEF